MSLSISLLFDAEKRRGCPYPSYLAQEKAPFRPYPFYLAEHKLFMPNRRDMDTFRRPRQSSVKTDLAFHQVSAHRQRSRIGKRRRTLSISPIFATFSVPRANRLEARGVFPYSAKAAPSVCRDNVPLYRGHRSVCREGKSACLSLYRGGGAICLSPHNKGVRLTSSTFGQSDGPRIVPFALSHQAKSLPRGSRWGR